MVEYTQYFGQFRDFRGNLGGLPSWARVIVAILALPGLILLLLSAIAFVVSLSALLLLTVPAYRLLRQLTAPKEPREAPPAGVRRVEATIIE